MNKQHFPNLARLIVLTLLAVPVITWANDCQQADRLYNDSLRAGSQQSYLLTQALNVCPNHVYALNNLATLRVQQGLLSEAQKLYKRAIEAAPNFALPYAGLGDVLMQRKRYQQAVDMFDKFLNKASGNRYLQQYVKRYEVRLEQAHSNIIVAANDIFESLCMSEDCITRNIGKPKLREIPIHFETESYQVKGKALQQCQEMAEGIHKAFRTSPSQYFRVRIEGHTDSRGTASFNKWLSEQRAKSVKEVLVNKFNVPRDRLVVVGFGEEAPVASNETKLGQLLNRRVTLVRLGK